MSTANPILCGTDLSAAAVRAADVAAAFARQMQRPLLLTSVAEPLIGRVGSKLLSEAVAVDREALEREADRLRSQGGTIEAELRSGLPAEEIASLAREREAALVIVSSHGRRAPLRWFLGSVAERVASSAPAPTLVVRDFAPLLDWFIGLRTLRVFVGIDFTENSNAPLNWVRDLRAIGPCEIHAAYVAWAPTPVALAPEFPSAPELSAEFSEDEETIRHQLEEKVAAHLGASTAQVHVAAGSGRVDARLVELASEIQADLIVVGSHQWQGLDRLWHHSVSRGILHHARMSVACVPSSATN